MPHGRSYDNVSQMIGNTPMVKLNRLVPPDHATVFAKCEFFQPLNSVKDRIGVAMIEAAEAEGRLKPGDTIVEPTSGNTGIGLAMVAAVKGYPILLAMSEGVSVERRKILAALGSRGQIVVGTLRVP